MSYGLVPCKECGAQLRDKYPPQLARGGSHHPDVPMDAYEAVNLLEALKIIPNTGDWHGQLWQRCEAILKRDEKVTFPWKPNVSADAMRARIK